jgi:hypothetical protein
MNELSPRAKDLLTSARLGLGPDASAVARMRAGIALTVSAPPPPSTNAAVPAAKIGATAAGKLAIVGAIAAVVAATSYVVLQRSATRVSAPVSIPLPMAPSELGERAGTSAPDPAPPAVAPPAAPMPAPRAPATAPATGSEAAAGSRHSEPRHRPRLGRETELLDAANSAFEAGDLERALASLRSYDREIGAQGNMAEDAAALEIEIACRRHEPTRRQALEQFDQRWPSSAYRVRLANACETE